MPTHPLTDLRPLNTLALPGRAPRYHRIGHAHDLCRAGLQEAPRRILGGGSNVVLPEHLDCLLLHLAIPGKQLLREDATDWYVQASAGESWPEFVLWTLDQGWPGLENLAMIPGTVGAAPIQNIGAYGLEVGELIHEIRGWDFEKQGFFTVDREQSAFSYRHSVFKEADAHVHGRFAITDVTFRLPKRWQPRLAYAELARQFTGQTDSELTPKQVCAAVMALRQQKLPDPAALPNAGSFFHNPTLPAAAAEALLARYPKLPHYPQADGRIKLAAGWLIEQAGWKGKRLGPVGMYAGQALILVNHGGAQRSDVLRTMQAVQADVFAHFQIALTPEPVFF